MLEPDIQLNQPEQVLSTNIQTVQVGKAVGMNATTTDNKIQLTRKKSFLQKQCEL